MARQESELADPQGHWQGIYETRSDQELSWRQEDPTLSIALIERFAPGHGARILDIGAGESFLLGALFDRGYRCLSGLDISSAALDRLADRLGHRATGIQLIQGDVLTASSMGPFDVWHDRAVFHFFTKESDRQRYVSLAAASVTPGGVLALATFSPQGPEQCSGLPVRRYSAVDLNHEFCREFEPLFAGEEVHQTPWGSSQSFTYVVMRRRPTEG